MTVSSSRSAYSDCYELLDQALETEQGIRVSAPTEGMGLSIVTRINYARVLDRQLMEQIHPEFDHPEHGISVYDNLIVSRPREEGGAWWVYIRPKSKAWKIEVLGAAE